MEAEQSRHTWTSNYALLWIGTTIAQLGSVTTLTATPLLALWLKYSPVFVGLLAAASAIPLLLHPFAGLMVDRFGFWRMMLIGQLVRLMATGMLIAGLATVGMMPFSARPLLIVVAIVEGLGTALYRVAEIASVSQIVPEDQFERALGKTEARQHVASLTGRPIGGLLFGLHHTFPYVFGAITSVQSIIALMIIGARPHRPHRADFTHRTPWAGNPHRTFWRRLLIVSRRTAATEASPRSGEVRPKNRPKGLSTALRHIAGDRFLSTTLLACALANFLFQTVSLLLIVMAHDQKLPAELFGLLLTASGLGGLLGSLAASPIMRTLRPGTIVIVGVWLWVPMIMIVKLSGQATVGLLAWGSCSFMGAIINVALTNYQVETVPMALLGRVTGFNRLLTGGTVSLGALISGFVVASFNPQHVASMAVLAFAAIAVVTTTILTDSAPGQSAETPSCLAHPFWRGMPGKAATRVDSAIAEAVRDFVSCLLAPRNLRQGIGASAVLTLITISAFDLLTNPGALAAVSVLAIAGRGAGLRRSAQSWVRRQTYDVRRCGLRGRLRGDRM